MQGKIKIEDLKIHCIIGAHPEERKEEQEISVNIELWLNFAECVQTDSIVDTVDYTEVTKKCVELAKRRRYHLLETLAYEMIHALRDAFAPEKIKICVKKNRAIPLAASASVELELSK